MKKKYILLAAFAATFFTGGTFYAQADTTVAPQCKAAYLCDFASGTEVYAKDETKRLPIASMCKIMTLLLSFEAVEEGNLAYDEMICVSENASGMGGSQVFLESNLSYRADELMKTVAVCSANDSCVALAERIGGSEAAFTERMNERAKELGADNTLFANCTGLPKEPQYSCAKDVSIMLRELLKHQKYFEFSKIWLEDFVHPDGRTTCITNTNKLIRFYEGCDGGKTGFTNEAGFCLAATAKRNDTRLIAVIIGAENSKQRFSDISNMLTDCFARYETRTVLPEGETEITAPLKKSKKKTLTLTAKNELSVFCKKGEKPETEVQYCLNDPIKAPVKKGDKVGEAVLFVGGTEYSRTDLLAQEDAIAFTWWEAYREIAHNWN